MQQARRDRLGFVPERIGSHWSRRVQADVIAISWKAHTILIGECKWGTERVDKQTVRHLLEHTIPHVLTDLADQDSWKVIPVIFARAGLIPAAQAEMQANDGLSIDVVTLWEDLAIDT